MALMNDLSWVPALRTEALTLLFTNITLLGYQVFLFLFLSFGFYFWRTRIFYQAGLLLFFTAGVNLFLKDFYQDPRPDPIFANSRNANLVLKRSTPGAFFGHIITGDRYSKS